MTTCITLPTSGIPQKILAKIVTPLKIIEKYVVDMSRGVLR
jgi:hypothetical protein